jgi:hypothetical protein
MGRLPPNEGFNPNRWGDAEVIRLVAKWGYDYQRAFEYSGHDAPATPRQAALIQELASRFPQEARELEIIVNGYSEGGYHALYATFKGNAMWVIKKLLELDGRIDDND